MQPRHGTEGGHGGAHVGLHVGDLRDGEPEQVGLLGGPLGGVAAG